MNHSPSVKFFRLFHCQSFVLSIAEMVSVCLSVRPHFWSRDNLSHLCMDRRETWFVYSCGLWHVNAPLNNFLTVLC